ncbi:DNA-directed RNA polymerase, RBP11-like protein [Corchorus capsularis]|uniref:DNA-directed RNA polymerase, RBP11-like protein n=1 Tax=Corchorus capsularis TaxID=210143 RepID=A0A1R3IU14_COCAP|nr:DNA-directed RNA polymerase, RBP11-like protein [Corchorus capsularis]
MEHGSGDHPAKEVLKDACQDLMQMCEHIRNTFDKTVEEFKASEAVKKKNSDSQEKAMNTDSQAKAMDIDSQESDSESEESESN